MSAGNSYFTEGRIENLIGFALNKFDEVLVMAPDEPAEHTYRALGYEDNKAKRKARLNASLLQNRARRVIESLDEDQKNKIKVVDWIDEVLPNKLYQGELEHISELYRCDKSFSRNALQATKEVLDKKSDNVKEESYSEAVFYLLKEIAFIIASKDIYNATSINYIYHKPWGIYQKLIEGEYDSKKMEEYNFVLHEQ